MMIGDLPEDLLGAIYCWCSSRCDRARFVAVCKSWRAAASWQPKLPAVPLLLNSTGNGALDRNARAYSPEDGRVLRAPLPWFPYGKRIVGCYDGGWVAATISWRIDIVNLFTCEWVQWKGSMWDMFDGTYIEKLIFSKDPSSEGCILAAMNTRRIAFYRIGSPGRGWTTRGMQPDLSVVDIAFCKGDLYALSGRSDLLYKLVIDDDARVIISLETLNIQRPMMFDPQYIFVLRGKLATAMEVKPVGRNEARSFRVFELATSDTTTQSSKYTWEKVTNLGDHALFLGPGCCKVVHVPATGMCGEVEGNHIYYFKHLENNVDAECLPRFDLGSCVAHCYKSEGVLHSERIMSTGYHYCEKYAGINGRNSCTWILPPQL